VADLFIGFLDAYHILPLSLLLYRTITSLYLKDLASIDSDIALTP
jgi:hypothetical protein